MELNELVARWNERDDEYRNKYRRRYTPLSPEAVAAVRAHRQWETKQISDAVERERAERMVEEWKP